MSVPQTVTSDKDLLDAAIRTLRVEAAGVSAVADRLGTEFVRAARMMLDCGGRVIVTGLGKSGIIARKIASTLASTGTPASFLHPTEAAHGDVGVMVTGDLLLVVSKSGANAELTTIVPAVRALAVPIVAICGTPESPLTEAAEVTIDAAVDEEACPLDAAPTASSTAALAVGDALAISLMHARGMDVDEFARLHPGGVLGRRLLWRVRDAMLTDDDLPTVGPDETLSTAMARIAHQRGTAVVVDADGRLLGVVTAGDLTRFADGRPDFLEQRVSEAMNDQPRTIGSDARATDALRLMETHGVMALPVLEAGVVVGIVHLHDLLRSGVQG